MDNQDWDNTLPELSTLSQEAVEAMESSPHSEQNEVNTSCIEGLQSSDANMLLSSSEFGDGNLGQAVLDTGNMIENQIEEPSESSIPENEFGIPVPDETNMMQADQSALTLEDFVGDNANSQTAQDGVEFPPAGVTTSSLEVTADEEVKQHNVLTSDFSTGLRDNEDEPVQHVDSVKSDISEIPQNDENVAPNAEESENTVMSTEDRQGESLSTCDGNTLDQEDVTNAEPTSRKKGEEAEEGHMETQEEGNVEMDHKSIEHVEPVPPVSDTYTTKEAPAECNEKVSDVEAESLVRQTDKPSLPGSSESETTERKEENQLKDMAADTVNEFLDMMGLESLNEKEKESVSVRETLVSSEVEKTSTEETKKVSDEESDKKTSKKEGKKKPDKSRAQKECLVCQKVKKCKYNIVRNGNVKHLCDDECFKVFRTNPSEYLKNENQEDAKSTPPEGSQPEAPSTTKVSENAATSNDSTSSTDKCAQCGIQRLPSGKAFVKWQGTHFCDEKCLACYQTKVSGVCEGCQVVLLPGSSAKFYLRQGVEVKQFCASTCLEQYKALMNIRTVPSTRTLAKKFCAECKKDLMIEKNSFMSPIGPDGAFIEFCSSICSNKYEARPEKERSSTVNEAPASRINQLPVNQNLVGLCVVCKQSAAVKHRIRYSGSDKNLCSTECLQKFQAQISNLLQCEVCHVRMNDVKYSTNFEGLMKKFCSAKCLGEFKSRQKSRRTPKPKKLDPEFVSADDDLGISDESDQQTGTDEEELSESVESEVYSSNKTKSVRGISGAKRKKIQGRDISVKFEPKSIIEIKPISKHTKHQEMQGNEESICKVQDNIANTQKYPDLKKTISSNHKSPALTNLNNKSKLIQKVKNKIAASKNVAKAFKTNTEANNAKVQKIDTSDVKGKIKKDGKNKKLEMEEKSQKFTTSESKTPLKENVNVQKRPKDDRSSTPKVIHARSRSDQAKKPGRPKKSSQTTDDIVSQQELAYTAIVEQAQQTSPRRSVRYRKPSFKAAAAAKIHAVAQDELGKVPVISSVRSLADEGTSVIAQATTTDEPKTPAATQKTQTISMSPSQTINRTITTPNATQQIIIQHPEPKKVKNKFIMCKPVTATKGTACKPHMVSKETQTDDSGKSVFVPVPVPVYIPVPMAMYSVPVPYPLATPVPVPIPCFIPTTKKSSEGIQKHIQEILNTIPADPFEAELLRMAEACEQAENKSVVNSDASDESDAEPDAKNDSNIANGELEGVNQALLATSGEDILQEAMRLADEMSLPGLDISSSVESTNVYGTVQDDEEVVTPRKGRGSKRTRGRSSTGKNKKAKGGEDTKTEQEIGAPPDAHLHLKFMYGVNAWKHWVTQKNEQLSKAAKHNRKIRMFKTDILQCTAEELNHSLCLFIKELRKPTGEEYNADSIYYLCLGIQQYLYENGRVDHIFSEIYYEKFTECLNDVLQRFEVRLNPEGMIVCRLEEEHLWESKQLGAHSPYVLLNTLIYFNTKYFMFRTPEEHLSFSFARIMKQWRKGSSKTGATREALLKYIPPVDAATTGKRKREEPASCEQVENVEQPLRCPVKLYDFYLSKCPESIKNRTDLFYLMPERSCVPDSPVWFSANPLSADIMAKMLNRIRVVKEVQEAHLMDQPSMWN